MYIPHQDPLQKNQKLCGTKRVNSSWRRHRRCRRHRAGSPSFPSAPWSCRWFPKPHLLGLVRNPRLISLTSGAVFCCDPDLRPRAEDEHYRLSAGATDTLECWIICGDESRASSDAGGEEVGGVTLWFHRDAPAPQKTLSPLVLFLPGLLTCRRWEGTGRGQNSVEVPLYSRLISIAGLFKLPPGGLTWNRTISPRLKRLAPVAPHLFLYWAGTQLGIAVIREGGVKGGGGGGGGPSPHRSGQINYYQLNKGSWLSPGLRFTAMAQTWAPGVIMWINC